MGCWGCHRCRRLREMSGRYLSVVAKLAVYVLVHGSYRRRCGCRHWSRWYRCSGRCRTKQTRIYSCWCGRSVVCKGVRSGSWRNRRRRSVLLLHNWLTKCVQLLVRRGYHWLWCSLSQKWICHGRRLGSHSHVVGSWYCCRWLLNKEGIVGRGRRWSCVEQERICHFQLGKSTSCLSV